MEDGQPQPQAPSEAPAIVPTPTERKFHAPILIGAGLLVALLAIGGFFVFANKPAPTPNTLTNQTTQLKQTPTPMDAMNEAATALPAGTDDTQLSQDMQTISASMDKSDADIKAVEAGLNDQGDTLAE